MTWWTSQRSSVIFRIFTQVVRGFFVVPCSTHPWSNWPWPLPAQSFSTCVWGEDSTHYPVQGEWKLRVSYGMTKVWPIDANNHGDIIIPRRNGQWGPLKPRDWWPFFCRKESTICYKILHFPTNLGASKKPKNLFLRPHSECFLHLKQTTSLTFGGSWSFVSNLVPQVCGVGMSRHVAASPLPWSLRWTWTSFLGSKPSIWTRSWRWTMPSWRHCSWSSKRSWSLGIYIYLKDRFGYLILNDLVLLWTE